MTSSPHGLYDQGYTRTTMAGTKGSGYDEWGADQKPGRGPGLSVQLDSMDFDWLVIGDQHATVITFPGLVHTARDTTRVGWTRRR